MANPLTVFLETHTWSPHIKYRLETMDWDDGRYVVMWMEEPDINGDLHRTELCRIPWYEFRDALSNDLVVLQYDDPDNMQRMAELEVVKEPDALLPTQQLRVDFDHLMEKSEYIDRDTATTLMLGLMDTGNYDALVPHPRNLGMGGADLRAILVGVQQGTISKERARKALGLEDDPTE